MTLEELEERVGAKYVAAVASRQSEWATFTLDMSEWFDAAKVPMPERTLEFSTVGQPLPPPLPGTPQFPREQWASYPAARAAALIAADRLLDFADTLTDEQWSTLQLVMLYGGKTRIA